VPPLPPLYFQISHLPHLAHRPPCLSHAAFTTSPAKSTTPPPSVGYSRECPTNARDDAVQYQLREQVPILPSPPTQLGVPPTHAPCCQWLGCTYMSVDSDNTTSRWRCQPQLGRRWDNKDSDSAPVPFPYGVKPSRAVLRNGHGEPLREKPHKGRAPEGLGFCH
jgi:hypothetical protein